MDLITVKQISPFFKEGRALNVDHQSKSFLLSWIEENNNVPWDEENKILLNLGTGCLYDLSENNDQNEIKAVLISDPSLKSSGDLINLLSFYLNAKKKKISLFGYSGLYDDLLALSNLLLGPETEEKCFDVFNYTGTLEHRFESGLFIRTFSMNKPFSVGFIIEIHGKKISFLPWIDFSDLEVLELVRDSDCLIIAKINVIAKGLPNLLSLKERYGVGEILLSSIDFFDVLEEENIASSCLKEPHII